MSFSKKDNFNLDKYAKALKKLSNTTYLPPFNVGGFYVNDRRGDTVVECQNPETAKILADLLNNLPSPDLLQKSEVTQDAAKVEVQVKLVEKNSLSVKEETTEAKIKKFL